MYISKNERQEYKKFTIAQWHNDWVCKPIATLHLTKKHKKSYRQEHYQK